MKRDPLEALLRKRLSDHAPRVDGEAAWADFERLRTPAPERRRRGGWWLFALFGLFAAGIGYLGSQYLMNQPAVPLSALPIPLATQSATVSSSLLPNPLNTKAPDNPSDTNKPAIPPTNLSTTSHTDWQANPLSASAEVDAGGFLPRQVFEETLLENSLTPENKAPDAPNVNVERPTARAAELISLSVTGMEPLEEAEPQLWLPIGQPKPIKKHHSPGWTIGAGAGYGAHFTRYRARFAEQTSYREKRAAVETPLDIHFVDLYGQLYFRRGWFVRLGGEHSHYQVKTELTETSAPTTVVIDAVVEQIRQLDGSVTNVNGLTLGTQTTTTASRVYYRDQRIGLQVGGGKRWLLPSQNTLEWFGGATYNFHILPAGTILNENGDLASKAAGRERSKTPLTLQTQLTYNLKRHYQIGLFAGTDMVSAGAHGLTVHRSSIGLRLGVRL